MAGKEAEKNAGTKPSRTGIIFDCFVVACAVMILAVILQNAGIIK